MHILCPNCAAVATTWTRVLIVGVGSLWAEVARRTRPSACGCCGARVTEFTRRTRLAGNFRVCVASVGVGRRKGIFVKCPSWACFSICHCRQPSLLREKPASCSRKASPGGGRRASGAVLTSRAKGTNSRTRARPAASRAVCRASSSSGGGAGGGAVPAGRTLGATRRSSSSIPPRDTSDWGIVWTRARISGRALRTCECGGIQILLERGCGPIASRSARLHVNHLHGSATIIHIAAVTWRALQTSYP